MTTAHTDRLVLAASHSYEGEAHGIRFRCSPARYAKGKMTLHLTRLTDNGGFKGNGERLVEALNGRYSHRCRGYHLSPSRAKLWRELFVRGYDADMDWRRAGLYGTKEAPAIEAPDGRKLTLKEAAKEVATPTASQTQQPIPPHASSLDTHPDRVPTDRPLAQKTP